MSLFSFKFWALKREIKAKADELQREFPDDPVHEAQMRAVIAVMKKNPDYKIVDLWTFVANEIKRRKA